MGGNPVEGCWTSLTANNRNSSHFMFLSIWLIHLSSPTVCMLNIGTNEFNPYSSWCVHQNSTASTWLQFAQIKCGLQPITKPGEISQSHLLSETPWAHPETIKITSMSKLEHRERLKVIHLTYDKHACNSFCAHKFHICAHNLQVYILHLVFYCPLVLTLMCCHKFVPRISGRVRWGQTTTSMLCFFPPNVMTNTSG